MISAERIISSQKRRGQWMANGWPMDGQWMDGGLQGRPSSKAQGGAD
jgi:hypothetical protein